MVQVLCKLCSKEFYAKPSWLRKGHGVYCSNGCRFKASRKGKVVSCFVCGEDTYKQPKALRRSKSGYFFCGKSCQTKWRNSEFIQEKHPNWKGGRYAYNSVMRRSNTPKICALCKTKDSRVLAVHHLDKNRKNNNIDNLVRLCHNCHHLVHRYPDEQERLMAAIV